jgi:septal ring factor EnvC (AmiA/AmiB activator)
MNNPMKVLLITFAVMATAQSIHAQGGVESDKLRVQREELARIRREREDLQRQHSALQKKAHSMAEEVSITNKQHNITLRAVNALGKQLNYINSEITTTTGELYQAQREAINKRTALRDRLAEIYKRGALYTPQVLLQAQSFGDLVARYKYLRLLALRDRAIARRMEQLRSDIQNHRNQLVMLQDAVEQNKREKAQEEARLRTLENKQKKNLAKVQQDAKKTKQKLDQLAKTEKQLNSIIASLEAARKRPGGAPNTPSTLKTSDYGNLAWPVNGDIIYKFGRVVNPNRTTIRWNGIGIAAPTGTPVKSVSSGTVVHAGQLGTYGNSIILDHGGGDYSVYSSLSRLDVRKGAKVLKGGIVGTVGSTDPDMPPHLHFEIRRGGPAVDPLDWLRGSN